MSPFQGRGDVEGAVSYREEAAQSMAPGGQSSVLQKSQSWGTPTQN